jgi:uncharacterized membrane protein YphA (DoxX/SURF4 family)
MAAASLQPMPVPTSAPMVDWHPLTRVAFRFSFCYLGLYSLITVSNVEEHLPYEKLWRQMVPLVGEHILHLGKPITYFASGSGDKTSDWVMLLCHLTIALAATAIWSIFDGRKEYAKLNDWLRVLLRYSVAWTMVAYGSAKVVKLQFADPSLGRLLEPLGDFSPMGLLWTFMGYSTPYTFFAGACELLGGLLLFFRRTTMLGALVTTAVMANVLMLNFAYDVPVKLLSAHVILMCLYLLIPDIRGMFDFFIRNKPAAPAPVRPHFSSRRMRAAAGVAKALFLGYLLVGSVLEIRQAVPQYGSGAPRSPLFGIWDVEEFTRDGQTVPPLLTDKTRWRRFVTQYPTAVSLRKMDDSAQGVPVKFDTANSTIVSAGKSDVLSLTWLRPDSDHLTLTGTFEGNQVAVRMKRMDETRTNLLGRGFHWVSEMPFNR